MVHHRQFCHKVGVAACVITELNLRENHHFGFMVQGLRNCSIRLGSMGCVKLITARFVDYPLQTALNTMKHHLLPNQWYYAFTIGYQSTTL